MRIYKVDNERRELYVEMPLTTQTGKIRVKSRNILHEYGTPVAARREHFANKHYIEWQIGYDVNIKDKEKMSLTGLGDINFNNSKGETKALYELSEYLYYFCKFNIINRNDILDIINYLSDINDNELVENNEEYAITRTHPIETTISGIDFYKSIIKYPLLIHKFDIFDIIVEIVVREKQRAVGVQPMLYVCFSITELQPADGKSQLLGRCADTKEVAYLILNERHKSFILKSFKIFGILSRPHKSDMISILNRVLREL